MNKKVKVIKRVKNVNKYIEVDKSKYHVKNIVQNFLEKKKEEEFLCKLERQNSWG